MKVLAVDDDLLILELITVMGATFGDISTASSGKSALEMLNQSNPVFDCLLLDICMPGLDGIELCGLIRAIPAYRKTPIIMLTSMNEKEYIDRAFRAGATDYATKPLDVVELRARLRMTQELVTARNEVKRSQSAIDVSDEIKIDGVRNLIEIAALRNYLSQLSAAALGSSQVMAVKIDDIDQIHALATKEEFLYVLSETAEAINQVLSTSGLIMAYAGSGIFLIVSGKATLEPADFLEAELQSILDDRNTEYDNGDALRLEISIGNPLRPSTGEAQGNKRVFERAIARAASRSVSKQRAPRPPSIRLTV